jgi:hypothetical protein
LPVLALWKPRPHCVDDLTAWRLLRRRRILARGDQVNGGTETMRHREEPQGESEAIRTLRAQLQRVTEALETLLADGFPMRPMSSSRDGVDEWERWHLDMEKRIADAHEALVMTERFSK